MKLKRWEDNTGSSAGYWTVSGTAGLVVYKGAAGCWSVGVKPSNNKDFHALEPQPALLDIMASFDPGRARALRWLVQSNLTGKRFQSRRSALSALREALETFPDGEVG